jgi:hypothetical protein
MDWIEEISSACKGHRAFFEWLVEYMKPKTIVELGIDRGYSTFVFAEALAKNTLTSGFNVISTVFGIDWFQGDGSTGYRDTRKEVEDNIENHKIKHVEIIKGDFNEIAKAWSRGIDILFIDGSHDYESVKQDFETWSKFVSPNGIILLHDTEIINFGVGKYFDEIHGFLKLELHHSCGLGVLTRSYELHEDIKRLLIFFNKIVK